MEICHRKIRWQCVIPKSAYVVVAPQHTTHATRHSIHAVHEDFYNILAHRLMITLTTDTTHKSNVHQTSKHPNIQHNAYKIYKQEDTGSGIE